MVSLGSRGPTELPNHEVMRIILGLNLIGINVRGTDRERERDRGVKRVGIMLEG